MVFSAIYFYSLAAALYINTCLVVAAVRWFHMCRPYNRGDSSESTIPLSRCNPRS